MNEVFLSEFLSTLLQAVLIAVVPVFVTFADRKSVV